MHIGVKSEDELLLRLAATDITVPLSSKGRTKEHVERWSVFRLLATLAEQGQLTYPLEAQPSERPDYLISLPSGRIGVEVTKAVPTDWARAKAHRARKNYQQPVMLEKFSLGKKGGRSPQDIDHIARGGSAGSVWSGSAVEEQFAEIMMHFSLKKQTAFGKPGFLACEKNWLIIYKDWPLPALDEALGAELFSRRIAALNKPLPFDRVFVECSSTFWEFSRGLFFPLKINDIWC